MGLVSGSCSLIIRGHDELNIDFINNCINISPTRLVRKGQVANQSEGEVKSDVWIYEMKLNKEKDINKTLHDLLMILQPCENSINSLTKNMDVCIRCYMQSELSQIGVDIQPDTILSLSKLNVKLELSIISWGAIEDN